jgi:hypothetical protein
VKSDCHTPAGFSLGHYRTILETICSAQYHPRFFHEVTEAEADRTVLLRHDVDFSLKRCLPMAQLEAEVGVKSTYFVFLACDFYNPFSAENLQAIRRLLALGHEIGLHFNPIGEDFRSDVDLQARMLGAMIGHEIKTVSFHRPPQTVLVDFDLSPYINAYDGKYFRGMKYLSDSNRRWREGCVCQWLKSREPKALQVLVHPIWWSDREFDSRDSALDAFREDKHIEMEDHLYGNLTDYTKKL